MPFLNKYFQQNEQSIIITPKQASGFARDEANDFNPIHDPEAKRFCVPGDLMFSLVLNKFGISEKMTISFEGMLGASRNIKLIQNSPENISICDAESGKTYLNATRNGNTNNCSNLASEFAKQYVAFSGHNFPHILVPLMEKHNAMINPLRPLVMYESMGFELNTLEFEKPTLKLAGAELKTDGKRGDATILFNIYSQDKIVGKGYKKLVLSGLRPFCQNELDVLINAYAKRKEDHQTQQN